MKVDQTRVCPLCKRSASLWISKDADEVVEGFEHYFGAKFPAEVDPTGFRMFRCKSCTLDFTGEDNRNAAPFYDWITQFSQYYPNDRWEWSEVLKILAGHPANMRDVLDFGCGSGAFLRRAREAFPGSNMAGVDLNQSSIEEVVNQGFEAICGTPATAAEGLNARFHFVTAFHCLEHVPDPLAMIRDLRSLLRDQRGSVIVSVPLSPLSIEAVYFDPLNHPPHHLTRWSVRAIDELGTRAGASYVGTSWSPYPGLTRSVMRSLALRRGGPTSSTSVRDLLELPIASRALVRSILRRYRSGPVGDILLAEMRFS